MTRRCGDVCKVTHLLRAHGQKLSQASLDSFDRELEKSLELVACGPLHPEAAKQAKLGTKQGGLGARTAADVALPAFVASRVQSQPLVMRLAETVAGQSRLLQSFERRYKAELDTAKEAFAGALTPQRAERLDNILSRASEDAKARAGALEAGRQLPRPTLASGYTRDGSEALISPAGGEDPEWEPELGGLQQQL